MAESALHELLAATPALQHKATLESVQAMVKAHRDTACGVHLSFADTVNDYIEKLMRGLE